MTHLNHTPPKLLCIDRDNVITINSSNRDSQFYHILHPADLIIKPNVVTAFELIFALEIPFVITTKQRALGTGKLTPETFRTINLDMVRALTPPQFAHMTFGDVLVESEREDKTNLFKQVIEQHPDLKPSEITVIDDSEAELSAARALGLSTALVEDRLDVLWVPEKSVMLLCPSLYHVICHLFSINP